MAVALYNLKAHFVKVMPIIVRYIVLTRLPNGNYQMRARRGSTFHAVPARDCGF